MTETQRYNQLANERKAALNKSDQTYQDLLNRNNNYSNTVNQNLDNYKTIQDEIYDKQLERQIELQNQNKEKAEQAYQKEAKASKNAYYDFINPYGVQAEIQAQNGLNRSGYSETAKSQAWTTQQNRTAQARAVMSEAKLQFDNAIKDAQLNNDTLKAQLALEILKQRQEEALRSFNYVSETKQNQLTNYQNLDSEYNKRYNTLYSQIQEEKARAEAIRQWNAEMKFKQQQAKIAQQQWEKEYALSQASMYRSSSSGSRSSGGSKSSKNSKNSEENSISVIDGNGKKNSKPADYYFSNNYQPQYIDGTKLSNPSGLRVNDVFMDAPVPGSQNVWQANGKYYVWIGNGNKGGNYVDVTSQVKKSQSKKMCLKW